MFTLPLTPPESEGHPEIAIHTPQEVMEYEIEGF